MRNGDVEDVLGVEVVVDKNTLGLERFNDFAQPVYAV